MDLAAFFESMKSILGCSGTAILFNYVVSIGANIHSGMIERVWAQRSAESKVKEDELLNLIESARPLREEFSRLALNAFRTSLKLGFDDEVNSLLGLLNDETFHEDLAGWILSIDAAEENSRGSIVCNRLMYALGSSKIGVADASKFADTFLELVQREVFSKPQISDWRNEVRQLHTQSLIQSDGQQTREKIDVGTNRVLAEIQTYLGPLIPTTADDVKRLRDIRDSHIEMVKRSSSVRVGGTEIKIKRPVVQATIRAALNGSHLLTGEPGAGKSICLIDAVIELRRQGYDVIYLDVQRLSADSFGSLKDELGLSFPIDQVLSDWPGRDKLFLCVDGLDAARSNPASRMIRDLIELTQDLDRWNVIASIRKFDMRYAKDLQRIFHGEPVSHEFFDQEFVSLRHLSVPILSDDELKGFSDQSTLLATLISNANKPLRDQLRIPFNIWLASDVINAGGKNSLFAGIRTQLQLLDLYWHRRVIRDDSHGDARESVAFATCREMVSRRQLKAPRNSIGGNPSASQPLNELLSSNVLSEWTPPGATVPNRQTLAFPHNTLFDYAANLSLFAGDPNELIKILRNDPGLLLFVLPSIRFFFQKLWEESPSHQRFWETTVAIAEESNLPSVCKVIGPSVSVVLANQLADYDLIFRGLEDGNSVKRKAAEEVIQHISSAVLIDDSSSAKRELWIEWTERLSQNLNDRLASSVNNLLWSYIND